MNNFKKIIKKTLYDYLNENKSYKLGDVISSKEMMNYIEDNQLRDSFGIIDDYNEIKNIAYASDYWKLENVDLSNFNWIADKNYENLSMNFYPIVLKNNNHYEVLDGKHRIGMYKDMGKNKTLMWVGY